MDDEIEEKEDGSLKNGQDDPTIQKKEENGNEVDEKGSLVERSIWDTDKIDMASAFNDFKNVNKSIVDGGFVFWGAITLISLIIAGVAFCLLKSIFCLSSINDIKALTPNTLPFWIFVIQKIGFIVIFLSLGIPFARLFSSVIIAIIESKERQTVRFVNMTKFLYLLKYKGDVATFDENYKPLVKNQNKEDASIIKDISSLVTELEKNGLMKLLKKIVRLLRG